MKTLYVAFYSLFIGLSSLGLYADDLHDKEALLDGLLARESLIQTGIFTFEFNTLVVSADQYEEGPPWPWPEDEIPYTSELTIAGMEWALRWPGTPFANMHRFGFSATYTETPQPDGQETYRSLIIDGSPGACKSLEKESEGYPLVAVFKAGAIPTSKISKFLEKNRRRIVYQGEEMIGDIKTGRLKIRIAKDEFSEVMDSLHPEYLKADAILITFYVAPSLNHAAVRIEYATPDGYVTQRNEATDFIETAKGVFFPTRYYEINYFKTKGRENYIYQYLVSDIRHVNESLPKSAFEMTAYKGTRVRDSRSDRKETVFYLDRKITFSNPEELIELSKQK